MPNTNPVSRINEPIRARGEAYQQPVEAHRERDRQRKQRERAQQSPEQRAATRARDRARKAEARTRQTPEQQEHEKERNRARSRTKVRPFMAIDGEGGGTDNLDRQNFLLMVAS